MSRDDERSGPTSPQGWRDLLKSDYQYPQELDTLSRRQRRRGRKVWREEDRAKRLQWVREQREEEPGTAGRILVLVFALVVVVFGSAYLFGHGHGGHSVSPTGDGVAVSVAPAPAASPSSPAASESESPPPNLSSPAAVADGFSRAYLTRNPLVDHDHTSSVERASGWMTAPLVDNLTNHADPSFDVLVSRAGVATVSAVKVEPAGTDLPGDSPLRVWRKVTITIAVAGQAGHDSYTDTRVLTEEIITSGDGQWRVSRILGV